MVKVLDSFPSLKRYFSILSNRNDKGNMYCSVILAQNITFYEFMDKASSALINLDYRIFPEASDHEETAEIGWLLYSTCHQDEERLSDLMTNLAQERIGVKWCPIRTNDRYRKDTEDNTKQTFALHLEGPSNPARIIRQKLAKWYGSKAKIFPDGTKMRLVPPFQSIISFNCKTKYSSLVALQAALSEMLCTSSTWELSVNLILDKPEPTTGFTLHQLILSIPSQIMSTKPLFHSVDRTWRSSNGITLSFLPENEADARSHVAGLIPFIKASHSHWFLKFFSEEAQLQHLHSKWDEKTRQAYSAEEAELDEFLADDDELNMTDKPTSARSSTGQAEFVTSTIASLEKVPTLYMDLDSVSTFHPVTPSTGSSVQPSTVFQPRIINSNLNHNTSSQPAIEIDTDIPEDISKISDTKSRISNIEGQLLQFHKGFLDLKKHTRRNPSDNPRCFHISSHF